ncbi:MAG: deoxyribodipyrimidine photo-lyase [Caldisericia bacterium]|nr:deoxyribodipyrimidine photo-lyase [Caldisericia bacterium]
MRIKERVIKHKEREIKEGEFVIYLMSRDQRVKDNFCINYGVHLAKKYNKKFGVLFILYPSFLDATLRQYDFMIKGLIKIEKSLRDLNIPFFIRFGEPLNILKSFIKEKRVCFLISDFSPLKISRNFKKRLKENIDISFYEIDTHNIIPPWIVSDKEEIGAFTIRKKINKILDKYLIEREEIKKLNQNVEFEFFDIEKFYEKLEVDKNVKPSKFFESGEDEAEKTLKNFIENKLDLYKDFKNDPTKDYLSNLSPYLHFGMISPLRVAIEILKSEKDTESKKVFLEELIVRRELSENFCFYNENYDNDKGLPFWARKTLEDHLSDEREYIYSLKDFEEGKTHDDVWNACQKEMVITGKMHGYMRMYWAKKILEWSKDYKEAIKIAIYLNDRYELDGRDPNGYTGIMWSIGGLHDRPFPERKIFGKVRFMSKDGLKRKFDIESYIKKVSTLERIS